ncbi:sigma-70 family RNA polymerase sigma factor [Pedobacter aquatilis]|uniref:sigma-70 family RNA polymerase sigma factor n=1 Tax=Pedobacter aquatilis TaxID=351343 RepID=UPI00292FBF23|nr:sigma-70 family RNA polymerase sigma factor [Pedobacter aquatilis]
MANKLDSDKITIINKAMFERTYELYWEKLYAVCFNTIREVEPAKEMVQDIFKSLWERRAELEIQKIEHYLVRSAKFKAFEYIRNQVSRQKHSELAMLDCLTAHNCTEEKVLFNNLKQQVNLLVDELPCQCKRVYKLSREEGMPNKDIATLLSISERAVEYHITKAMGKLKSGLANY